jgi:hypothetical protein
LVRVKGNLAALNRGLACFLGRCTAASARCPSEAKAPGLGNALELRLGGLIRISVYHGF